MGVQIPRGIHSEMQEKDAVRATQAAPWRDIQEAGCEQGKQDRRRAFDAGSCAHADFDTTKVCGIAGSGVHQRQKCDLSGTGIR